MNSAAHPKETKTVVFRLDHEEFQKIDAIAKRFHINRSSVLRISVAKLIDDVSAGYLRLPGNHVLPENDSPAKEQDIHINSCLISEQ